MDARATIPLHGRDPLLDISQPEGRTDIANARRFAARFGNDIRWCDPWNKWLLWNCNRWIIDEECRIESYAKGTVDELWNELVVFAQDRKKHFEEIVRFCTSSGGKIRIGNLIALARSEPGIAILPSVFDTDLWSLNTLSGTIDLQTSALRLHSRNDYITKLAPVTYDPNAECPRWHQFLGEVFDGDDELIRFVRRAAGYSLTGLTVERCLFFLFGKGRNGKTTFVSTLRKILGDYARTLTTEMLMVNDRQRHPTENCDLFRARMAIANETEDGQRFAESFIKQITGGEDPIKGRRMKENFWEFQATHKLWICGNHRPEIRGSDDAIWDRIRLIPFNVRFENPDKTLAARLEGESSGILNWLLLGCAEWQAEGLGEPSKVIEATRDYRTDMDSIGSFIDQRCITGPDYHAGATALHTAYRDWGGTLNQKKFGHALTERGFQSGRFTLGDNKGRALWKGIGLLASEG